jgi:collagenase-like PrtC family protease
MTTLAPDKLTLGPVVYNWPPEALRDFYFRIADEAPVDSVCVGEVVCAKRTPFFQPYLPEVSERLAAAGKEVVLSTQALIMSGQELDAVRAAIAETAGLLPEANDIGTASLLAGQPHVIGPYIGVYNEGTLECLARRGAVRVSLTAELPANTVAALAKASDIELEVQVFGRMPLALSARCYHARIHGLQKDGCQFVCGEDPDGLVVRTLDDEPFLAVNGVQTLSHTYCNLAAEIDSLREMGVGRFRLSPQDTDMAAVARAFRDLLDGRSDGAETTARLGAAVGDVPFSNGYFHGCEGVAALRSAYSPRAVDH